MRGFSKKLAAAEKEYAQYPSQSTRDRVTYLRGLHELPGSPLTVDQSNTMGWISNEGRGRAVHEVKHLHKRDLTCIEKQRSALVQRMRMPSGERRIFMSDLGRFYLHVMRDLAA